MKKGSEMKHTMMNAMMDSMARMRADGDRAIASRESMIATLMMPDASGPGQAAGAAGAAATAMEPISALGRLILRLAAWTPALPDARPAVHPIAATVTIAKEATL